MLLSRRAFLRWALGGVAAMAALAGYPFVEAMASPRVARYRLTPKKWTPGLKLHIVAPSEKTSERTSGALSSRCSGLANCGGIDGTSSRVPPSPAVTFTVGKPKLRTLIPGQPPSAATPGRMIKFAG